MRELKHDLTGKTFGRLVVLKRVENKGQHVAYLCRCQCGKEFVTMSMHLTQGCTKSCGCLQREWVQKGMMPYRTTHGHSKTRLYSIWANMKTRCFNKNVSAYSRYGGRGITVCNEWLDFALFEKWALANGYDEKLTLDRVNNDGNYCPENCRWVSVHEQNLNKRSNSCIEYNGEKKTVTEWAKILNIPYRTLKSRIQRGWSIEDAFNPKDFSYRKGVRKHGKSKESIP